MVHVLVMLHAGKSGIEGLSAFEAKVMPLILEHGGVVLSAFRPEKPRNNEQPSSNNPDEIHLLQFPSHESLANYQADSRLLALKSERSLAIAKTELFISESILDYGTNAPAGSEKLK